MDNNVHARVDNSIIAGSIKGVNDNDRRGAKAIVQTLDFSDLYRLRNVLQQRIDAGLIATIPPPDLAYSQLVLDECNHRAAELESKKSDN